jgi:prolyl oligopeptidase
MLKIVSLIAGILLTQNIFYAQPEYPETKKEGVADEYFGVRVPDPYRWLEDDNADEVKEWVEKQNEVTFGYLKKIPYRDKIKTRYEELFNFLKYSDPFKEGERYFFFKNDGIQNQYVLYTQENLNAEPEVFLDLNKFSSDGTISLTTYAVSKDGKYFAYGTASGGSDWNEFFVMEVATKKKLDDHLKWIKFSGISWKDDGFYYSRFPEPKAGEELQSKNENGKIYYHKLGTEQINDILIYEEPENPARYFFTQTTEDERFLVIYIKQSTSNNSLKVKNLSDLCSKLITLVDNFENNYTVIDNLEDKFLIQTDKNASNYRLVLIDPKNPSEENWKHIFA